MMKQPQFLMSRPALAPVNAQSYKGQRLQQGSVLFMALVFLFLTAMIAVTSMDTGILSRRMAGNNQIREEAMQITEGIVNETAMNVIDILQGIKAPNLGDVLCKKGSTDPECSPDQKILALSTALNDASKRGATDYKARFTKEDSQGGGGANRMGEGSISEGLLMRYVEVEGTFNGVTQGLSQASLAIGIMNKALSANGGGKKDVTAGATGSGTGSYGMIY